MNERSIVKTMNIAGGFVAVATALFSLTSGFSATLGSVFSYSGRLEDKSAPANGRYDVVAALFDAEMGGVQIGEAVTNVSVVVSNGLLMTTCDFGPRSSTALPDGWSFPSAPTEDRCSPSWLRDSRYWPRLMRYMLRTLNWHSAAGFGRTTTTRAISSRASMPTRGPTNGPSH